MSRVAAALAAAALLTPGCRSLPHAVPLQPDDGRPSAYLAALALQGEQRQALRGVARVALDGPAGGSRSKQILVVARPARLRVEVQGFLSQLVAVLVSDGTHFELYRAEDRSVEQGEIHPWLLYEVAGLPLRPEDAVQVLLGVPRLDGEPLPRSARALSDGHLRVDLADAAGGGLRRVDFDAGAKLRRVEVWTPAGELAWRARYDDYRRVGDASFAHDIALEFPLSGARAEVSFQRIELNPELPPDAFELGLAAARGERG